MTLPLPHRPKSCVSHVIQERLKMKAKALTACMIFLAATTTLARAEPFDFHLSATASGFDAAGGGNGNGADINDDIPDEFSFPEIINWEAGLAASAETTITGITTPTQASITGVGNPKLRIADSGLVSGGSISNGEKLTVSLVPPDWESTYAATVKVGEISKPFIVKTGIQPVSISLADVEEISATQNEPFSLDLKAFATVTGGPKADPANPSKLSWSIGDAGSALPQWLSLDASTGILSGTPTKKESTSFEVVGNYLDADGRRVYRIDVAGVVLEAVQISVGNIYACAVMTDGGVKCWGDGYKGKTGQGSENDIFAPADVATLGKNVRQVSAGGDHTCAVLKDNTVKCWGSNAFGQLGNGTTTTSFVPVTLTGLTDVDQIVAGSTHTCATLKSGGVKCWGAGGRIGDGTPSSRHIPTSVSGIAEVVKSISISSQGSHTCIATNGGEAKCWGPNTYGQIGNGNTDFVYSPYTMTNLGGKVRSVAVTDRSSCALLENGSVKCWGRNDSGLLGNGGTNNSFVPVDAVGLSSGVTSISAGQWHVCAVQNSGLKCWGTNSSGDLGNGGTQSNPGNIPAIVLGLSSNVASVSAGSKNTCALMISGGTKCWGYNIQGSVGDGTGVQKSSPVDITY
ncbi:putative Ig domain-containing protein [Rhodovulum viride]|uniref:putative Ig domain-containing protein n=1 Tax=Rhodovulum viride TaxID=1231134 RepID=UPI0011BDCADF|nr:putative Ig domain-containing protein [Rhodovulum viride]